MNADTQKQARSLKANYERTQARKRLQSAISTLQRSMYDMECILEKLDDATDDSERSKHLNAAINHLVCNIQPNLRIELLANSQAELAVMAAQGAAK
jgi:acetyl-CoA carboxylase carboxyltransferase component